MHTLFGNLRTFAHAHDDIPAFHAAYFMLTLISAAMLNLGCFGILILAHLALDLVKYREVHKFTWGQVLKGMVHESIIDITLFTVALVFSVYLHHSVGMVAVSGLLRAELTVARFIGTMIPKFFILEHFLKAIAHLHHYLEYVHPQIKHGWRAMDWLCLSFTGCCLLLLFMAPSIMNVDASVVRLVVYWELVPWHF